MAVEASARVGHRGNRAKRGGPRVPGGGRRAVGKRAPRVDTNNLESVAQAEDERRIAEVRDAEQRLTALHLQHFPTAERPLMTAPEAVDEEALRRREAELLVDEVPWFKRRAREAARAEAERNVEAQIARLRIARIESLERAQERSDQMWQALLDHEPDAVRDAVEFACASSGTPAVVVDLRPRERRESVCVAVPVGGVDIVPAQTVVLSTDGTPRIRSRTPDEAHACHFRAVASTVLATAARVLAASPSTEVVTVVAARRAPAEAGVDVWTAVYAGAVERELLAASSWREQDPAKTVLDQPGSAVHLTGARREVGAVHPSAHPDVNRALAILAARSRVTS